MKLRLGHYRFSFRALTPIHFSHYLGSTLRGVFGHALMRMDGLTQTELTNKGAAYYSSHYAAVFEPPFQLAQVAKGVVGHTVPYVIKAPIHLEQRLQPEDIFSFEMILLPAALPHLAAVLLAWRRALLQGLGKRTALAKAELVLVEQVLEDGGCVELYSEANPSLRAHNTEIQLPVFTQDQRLHLCFQTPLRLQHKGKVLAPNQLTGPLLVQHILRRFCLCFPQHIPQNLPYLFELAQTIQSTKNLHTQDWKRYSNRQQHKLHLTGVVGDWFLHKVPKELLAYIWLGQYLHVGKNTSFGLGGYKLLT